jgi:hypothetical protein
MMLDERTYFETVNGETWDAKISLAEATGQ